MGGSSKLTASRNKQIAARYRMILRAWSPKGARQREHDHRTSPYRFATSEKWKRLASASSSREDSGLLLDFDSERAYGTTALPIAGSHGEEARPNPDERAMGSTASGSAAPLHAIGPALPPHIEIKRDGGGREGVGGH